MSQAHPYPSLFSDIKIGSAQLKNRIVHAAITTGFVKDGSILDSFSNYYLSRAQGGAAGLIMEPSNVHSGQTDLRRPDIFNSVNHDSLKTLVGAVEEQGCRFFAQIQDSGRGVRELGRNDSAVGASALPDDLSWTVPHAMSLEQIKQFIEETTVSCSLMQKIGFSGIEISAGHGHLFHQFMSPWSNHRDDQYGGDITGRTRLTVELIQAIRSEVGKDFTIGIKLPGVDGVVNSIDIVEANQIAETIAATGEIDFWTFCKGSHANSLFEHLPDAHGQRTPYMQEIQTLRKTSPAIPTGALGYITDPNEAERLLSDGTAELIMLGRPLITDPAWPNKSEQGREAEIRYCVSCNTCWRAVIDDGQVACDNNPRVGKREEVDWRPITINNKKKVVIVGAGVAGMEAAWVAGARGHDVTVLGKSVDIGGKTRLHAGLPGGENLSSIYDYQLLSANHANVKFELGLAADLTAVTDFEPDHVILASGSTMRWPEFLPAEYIAEGFFLDLRELLITFGDRAQRQQGRIVIYDQDHTEMTYAAAEFYAKIFDQVVVITPRERVASDVSLINRQGIYHRLYQNNIKIVTSSIPSGDSNFEDGQLKLENIYNQQESSLSDVAVLTYSTPRIPNDELVKPLQNLGLEISLAGDCYAPRSVLTATREGHAIGESV